MTIQEAFDLAVRHHQAGRLAEAESLFRQVLAAAPADAASHHYLGLIAHQVGKSHVAVPWIRRAIDLAPYDAAAHSNLGEVLRTLGRPEEAVASLRHAIELAIQLDPRGPSLVAAVINLSIALCDCGRPEEAVAACSQAVEIEPGHPTALGSLGVALGLLGRHDEAIAALREAVARRPGAASAWNNLGNELRTTGRIREAVEAFRRAAAEQPTHADFQSNLVYALLFDPETDDETIAAQHRRWNEIFDEPARTERLPSHDNDPDPERRLRIGYVSADFRDNVVGWYLTPLFRCHDRSRHEIVCWSGVVRSDGATDEFRRRSDAWHSTLGRSDDELAAMIREAQIDILVDLSQHIAGNRLAMFTRRPAPVQVSFAGYPASAGVDAIGHRISDRFLESGSSIKPRAEQVHLIDAFLCYDPCGMTAEANELPAAESGWVTFGCLNAFSKVNERVLKAWARVLGATTDSRLLISSVVGTHRGETAARFEREGIDRSRIEFATLGPRRDYMEQYRRIDIALDPFPYGGYTTSLDALWMGVPIVSLVGERSVSRPGLGLLTNLGLPELAARSEDDYVDIAARLARDLPRLAELRRTLRSRLEASALMDGPRFAGGIESCYRRMWTDWCVRRTRRA